MTGATNSQIFLDEITGFIFTFAGHFFSETNGLYLMSKAFFYRFFVLFSSFALLSGAITKMQAQPSCEITIDKTIPVCPGSKFQLSVPEGENYKYLWKLNGDSITNSSSFLWKLTEDAEFIVRVTDTVNSEECESDPFLVSVHTPIDIKLDQIQLTCTDGDNDNGNNARVKAIASGEFQADEYHYFWEVSPIQISPGDSSLAQGLKAHQLYSIEVKDNYGCSAWDTIWTKAYDNPVVKIYTEPDSIAYIQNPDVAFFYNNLSIDSIDIISHFWVVEIGNPAYPDSVLDDLPPDPIVRFETIGVWPAHLTVRNPQGCDTTYNYNMEIKPVKLFIPNVFTPNGDDKNELFQIGVYIDDENKDFEISLNDYYLSSELVIFNRWGKKVYESNDYDNKWDGGKLADGVYYYVLKCQGAKSNDVFKGAVTIVGTGSRP
jgi:gliding motility-associated-like protein